jgi:hypothetical protein
MKRAVIFLIVVASACTSTSNAPLSGRIAIMPLSRGAGIHSVEPFIDTVRADLAARGAMLDVLDSATAPSGYDSVIVVTVNPGPLMSNVRLTHRAEPPDMANTDAAGATLPPHSVGKLNYEIFRNGSRIDHGAVNLTGTLPDARIEPARSENIQAAHVLAREIARSLARS